MQNLELLNTIYVVGMTVYPFMILARDYSLSQATTRAGRLRDCLGKVGGCVVFGCGVSIGIAAFVQLGVSQFFYKFGMFMFLAMFLSAVFALCFFATLLAWIGPLRKNIPVRDKGKLA